MLSMLKNMYEKVTNFIYNIEDFVPSRKHLVMIVLAIVVLVVIVNSY
jgi:hypothetical protein